jgi:hypothetical protein
MIVDISFDCLQDMLQHTMLGADWSGAPLGLLVNEHDMHARVVFRVAYEARSYELAERLMLLLQVPHWPHNVTIQQDSECIYLEAWVDTTPNLAAQKLVAAGQLLRRVEEYLVQHDKSPAYWLKQVGLSPS